MQGTASYRLSQLPVRDYHDLANALAGGPSDPATVSFDVAWGIAGEPFEVRDEQNRFTGTFRETKSTISWSASGGDELFVSDRPETSRTVFAAVGRERNGAFFS